MPVPKPKPWRRRPRFRSRPFFVSTALILSLVALHTLVPGLLGPSSSPAVAGLLRRDGDYHHKPPRDDDLECRLVHQAADKCAFVRANCQDESAGLLPYITFYYCSIPHVQPLAFGLLVVWLGLLFTTIGIAASDFFSVNLGTIASILGLSESLAGVTFLALGNGSPDVFSTFAAMGSNSGSMAVGELIGAAGFITGVVAGSMALVREFKVSRRTFVRDICFFIVAVSFAMVFLADGKLMLWECCVMIGFYLFYVLTVVGWHWVSTRRKRRRALEAASRSHFYGTTVGAMGSSGGSGGVSSGGDDDLAPYHDGDSHGRASGGRGVDGQLDAHDEPEPDDTAPVGGRREQPPPDISALERGPRIEVDSVEGLGEADPSFDNEAQGRALSEEARDRRNRHISAEMTSSMRVNRPRGRRSTTAITPIRPSLLGALEFRSVLASLQRSGTMHLAPIDRRRLASQHRPSLSRGYSVSAVGTGVGDVHPQVNRYSDDMSRSALLPQDAYRRGASVDNALNNRDRALSSGDRPFTWAEDSSQLGAPLLHTPILHYSDTEEPQQHGAGTAGSSQGPSPFSHSVEPSAVTSPDATTTTPTDSASVSPASMPTSSMPQQHLSRLPSGLHLEIPTRRSPHSSPSLSPFPGYTESPRPLSPAPPSRTSSLPLSQHGELPTDDGSSFPGLDDNADIPKPIRWWPYDTLPAPHIIAYTLFPSLAGWREKTIWDKFVSLISAPTVLLLVVTLPVVEMDIPSSDETEDDDGVEEDLVDEYAHDALAADDGAHEPLMNGQQQQQQHGHGVAGAPSTPSLVVSQPEGETEWQRYRRSTILPDRPLLPSPVIQAMQAEDASDDAISSTAVSMHSSASAAPSAAAGGDGDQEHRHHRESSIIPAIPATTATTTTTAKPVDRALIVELSEAEAVSAAGWNRWLVAVQLFAGPQFTAFILWANMAEDLEQPGRDLLVMVLAALVVSGLLLAVLLATTTAKRRPKYHSLLCFLGFIISVAWISTVAGEVVGVLKAFGVIVGISEAILGLTIFAVGNSLGDLVADITVARLGYPVMALSACFGGPMLNILLGVGIGGAWMSVKAAKDRGNKHPDQPVHYEPYSIQVGSSLMVSAVTVLVTLVFLLVAVPANKWVMSRRIGLALIGLWTVSTILNVILEVTGAWR